ncbi:MAG: hypothetical protein DRG58_05260 [Deltaproteobacteria bacterium]|nr:MAG: hypothetical protein DRG58_05260 [Deltaproteobacteria bacterium]
MVVRAHKHDKQIVSACLRFPGEDGLDDLAMAEFGTLTDQLLRLRDWLREHGCPLVALASTGV